MTALEYPAVLGEMCVVIIWMEVDEAWMQGPYVLVNRCVHDSGRMQDRINVYGAVIRVNVDQYRFFCQSSFAWQRAPAGNVYMAKVKRYIDFY